MMDELTNLERINLNESMILLKSRPAHREQMIFQLLYLAVVVLFAAGPDGFRL